MIDIIVSNGNGVLFSLRDREIILSAMEDYARKMEADKWVKVEDGLPEIDSQDEWNLKNRISEDVWTYGEAGMRKGRYYYYSGFWTVDGFNSSNGIVVTHWQKLPEPPIDKTLK